MFCAWFDSTVAFKWVTRRMGYLSPFARAPPAYIVGVVEREAVAGVNGSSDELQATGLDAWASRVKCPARFVSHLHDMSCS